MLTIEELEKYEGVTPRPADFDEYWERAMEEMHSVDPKVEMILSDFVHPAADCFDMYFTGVGNSRIHAKIAIPKQHENNCPALLWFHGYTGAGDPWLNLVSYAAAGFVTVAMDCRGQGGSSEDMVAVKGNTYHGLLVRGVEDEPEKLQFRRMYLDAAQLTELVMAMEQVDADKVYTQGMSQGGGLALLAAALVPRVAKCVAIAPFLSDFKQYYLSHSSGPGIDELGNWFRVRDPLHKREEEFFTKLGYVDIQNLAHRIRAKVQLYIGLADVVCPPKAQFAAYNKITSEKEVIPYEDYGHEMMPNCREEAFGFLLS